MQAATVPMSRPKLGQALLLILVRPRPLLDLFARDLVASFKVGHCRQEVLHGGQKVGRIEAGLGRTGWPCGMILARACGKAAEGHQLLLVKSWVGYRRRC